MPLRSLDTRLSVLDMINSKNEPLLNNVHAPDRTVLEAGNVMDMGAMSAESC